MSKGFEAGKNQLEDNGPHEQRDQDLACAGHSVVPSQSESSEGVQHDGNPERYADQVVEAAVQEYAGQNLLEEGPVCEVQHHAQQEQRVSKISESHESVVREHVEGEKDKAYKERRNNVYDHYCRNPQDGTPLVLTSRKRGSDEQETGNERHPRHSAGMSPGWARLACMRRTGRKWSVSSSGAGRHWRERSRVRRRPGARRGRKTYR